MYKFVFKLYCAIHRYILRAEREVLTLFEQYFLLLIFIRSNIVIPANAGIYYRIPDRVGDDIYYIVKDTDLGGSGGLDPPPPA